MAVAFDAALASLPEVARPRPGDPDGPRVVARSDAAGATHDFARHCSARGLAFSFGFRVTAEVRDAVGELDAEEWREAVEADDEIRDGAWIAELTDFLDLGAWPVGSRVIVRKERPHPGAQLSLFDMVAGSAGTLSRPRR